MKEENKELIKGLGVWCCFFFSGMIAVLTLSLFGIKLDGTDYKTLVIYDFVLSSIIAVIAVIVYRKLLKDDLIAIKENKNNLKKDFIKITFYSFAMFMMWKFVGAMIETGIFESLGIEYVTSENQSIIEELQNSAPLLMAFSVTFLAPISEEIIFRGMLGKVIKNKKVLIPVSGLIFGLMHVTGSVTILFEILLLGIIINKIVESSKEKKEKITLSVISVVAVLIIGGLYFYITGGNIITQIINLELTELINGVTYVVMGFYLAYIYCKYENIYINIGVHALNNGMSAIMMLFML